MFRVSFGVDILSIVPVLKRLCIEMYPECNRNVINKCVPTCPGMFSFYVILSRSIFFRISIFHILLCELPCHLELSTFYLFFPHLPVSNWLHFSHFPQPIGCVSFIYGHFEVLFQPLHSQDTCLEMDNFKIL